MWEVFGWWMVVDGVVASWLVVAESGGWQHGLAMGQWRNGEKERAKWEEIALVFSCLSCLLGCNKGSIHG